MKTNPTSTTTPSLNTEEQSYRDKTPRKKLEENIIIAIQATMISKLFPGKVLAKLNNNVTVLEFLVRRIKEANFASQIAIVTSDLDSDIPIVEEGNRLGVKVVRGSHDDLIQRFIFAADELKADSLVRILGSNPLLDIEALDELIGSHFAGDWEYSFNDGSLMFADDT